MLAPDAKKGDLARLKVGLTRRISPPSEPLAEATGGAYGFAGAAAGVAGTPAIPY